MPLAGFTQKPGTFANRCLCQNETIELHLTLMTVFETIVRELVSTPEPLLVKVLDFIQTVKGRSNLATEQDAPRVPGLHKDQIWISEDFNEPLPDEFWLGEQE